MSEASGHGRNTRRARQRWLLLAFLVVFTGAAAFEAWTHRNFDGWRLAVIAAGMAVASLAFAVAPLVVRRRDRARREPPRAHIVSPRRWRVW